MAGGRIVCAGVAALLLAFFSQAATAAGDTAWVESVLTLDADRSGEFVASEQTSLRVPLANNAVRRMLMTPPGGNGRTAGNRLLRSHLGLFGPALLERRPSVVRIEGEGVYAAAAMKQEVTPGSDEELGPFVLRWRREGLLVGTPLSRRSKATWTVRLELDQIGVGALLPPPAVLVREGSRTTLEWRFRRGRPGAIRAELVPPWAVQVRADVYLGAWRDAPIGIDVLLVLLFFLFFLLVWRRRGPPAEEGKPDRAKDALLEHQLKWLLIAAALALLHVFAVVLRASLLEQQHGGLGLWTLVEVLPVLFASGCIGAVFAAGRHDGVPLLAKLLGATAVVVLVLGSQDIHFAQEGVVDEPQGRFATPLLIATLTSLLLLLYGMVDGLLRVALAWIDGAMRTRWGILRHVDAFAVVLSVLLALGTLSAIWIAADELLPSRFFPFYVAHFLLGSLVLLAVALALLAVQPAAIRMFRRGGASGEVFLVEERGLWLFAVFLYLLLASGTGKIAGFPLPIPILLAGLGLALLGASRVVKLERLELRLRQLNHALAAPASGALLVVHRLELITRSLLIERGKRRRAAEHPAGPTGAEAGQGAEAFLAYRRRVEEFDEAEAYLQKGEPSGTRQPSRADRELVRLRFPARPDLAYPALACGPGRDWRENARIALGFGALAAAVPVAVALVVLLRDDIASILDPVSGLEPLLVLGQIAAELGLWLVAAYLFGALFSWLPSGNGPVKGTLLALPVIVSSAVGELTPFYEGNSDWLLRSLELLFFLSLLGLLMDLRTMRRAGLRWRDLSDLYQVRSFRFGVLNLAPLLLSAVGIYFQVRAGDTQGAVERGLEVPGQFAGAAEAGITGEP